jgi:hypothetical protein
MDIHDRPALRLPDNLWRANSLELSAERCLNIFILKRCACKHLRLQSDRMLGIEFEDVAAFVAQLPCLKMSCRSPLNVAAYLYMAQAVKVLGTRPLGKSAAW